MSATLKAYVVEYDSNNSGGEWWLKDGDWEKLEDAGWFVKWGGVDFCNDTFSRFSHQGPSIAPNTHEKGECPGHRRFASYAEALDSGERWLGCLARDATIEVQAYSETLAAGVASNWWADTLGMNPDEEGCNCCGQPHYFGARESKS